GIRDFHVTGVQTCALPICASRCFAVSHELSRFLTDYFFECDILWNELPNIVNESFLERKLLEKSKINGYRFSHVSLLEKKKGVRSEERRVGKECRCEWCQR